MDARRTWLYCVVRLLLANRIITVFATAVIHRVLLVLLVHLEYRSNFVIKERGACLCLLFPCYTDSLWNQSVYCLF